MRETEGLPQGTLTRLQADRLYHRLTSSLADRLADRL